LAAIPRHGNHWRLRRPHDTQRLPTNLDVSRRQLRVAHLRRTRGDVPSDEDDALGAERTRELERFVRRVGRIEGYLNDARAVAEVDEDEPTEVTTPVHPATQT